MNNSFYEDIENCITTLKKGGTILYPTDTIWGIGCDATNQLAVQKVFSIKKRTRNKAMIILFNDVYHINNYIPNIPEKIQQMMHQNPKPLTVIFSNAKNELAKNIEAEDESIAIRITREIFSNDLITKFTKPIVSTSANISSENFPSNFAEISSLIINSVDYVVKYRQLEKTKKKPSKVIKIMPDYSFQIIRE